MFTNANSHMVSAYMQFVLLYRYVSLFGNRWVRLHGLGFIHVFSMNTYLRNRLPAAGGCVYVLQFFCFFFVFRFSVHQNYETTVLGNG